MKTPSPALIPAGLAMFFMAIFIAATTDWTRPEDRGLSVLRYLVALGFIGAGAWLLRKWRDG